MHVSTIKTTTPDQNDLKLGTVVVLDSLWKSTDFGFKRWTWLAAQSHHLLAPPSYSWHGCSYKVQIVLHRAMKN